MLLNSKWSNCLQGLNHFGALSFYYTFSMHMLDAIHLHATFFIHGCVFLSCSQFFVLLFFFFSKNYVIHYGNIYLQFCKVYFTHVMCLFYSSSLFYLVMDVNTNVSILFYFFILFNIAHLICFKILKLKKEKSKCWRAGMWEIQVLENKTKIIFNLEFIWFKWVD